MKEIRIQRSPDEEDLKKQGIFNWPIRTKGASESPWTYDDRETL